MAFGDSDWQFFKLIFFAVVQVVIVTIFSLDTWYLNVKWNIITW